MIALNRRPSIVSQLCNKNLSTLQTLLILIKPKPSSSHIPAPTHSVTVNDYYYMITIIK